MLIKIFTSVVLVIAVILLAGVYGLTFYVWPTSLHDEKLMVTPEVMQSLRSLKLEHKFGPDSGTFYPGAKNEEQRLISQAAVDAALQSLITELPVRPQRSTVLRTFKVTLANFDTSESEERDQILSYLTKVMNICGVNNSSELFNVWRYGFPYGWFL
ncbi:DUF4844 domain-containing protein [Duganella sp. FT94W]|uniref:DUF4844 domain-containing protein n=1 Tax=Duganella lactea TaxID=2692173 RepID=A0ABW9V404_9BURK|nr:DUF4844 domain-containing protein [Duganella lactea]MYM33327.1 DUF4844 domain-containing protein [Duganella lactea]